MSRVPLGDKFEDERGKIQDLIGRVDAVTHIHTFKGAVRGNHFHKHTTQWTYVTHGALLVAQGDIEMIVEAGEMVVDRPGVPHAWKALEDTDVLVFARGPRAGKEYESDTFRLERPLIEPVADWDMVARCEYETWVPTQDRAP